LFEGDREAWVDTEKKNLSFFQGDAFVAGPPIAAIERLLELREEALAARNVAAEDLSPSPAVARSVERFWRRYREENDRREAAPPSPAETKSRVLEEHESAVRPLDIADDLRVPEPGSFEGATLATPNLVEIAERADWQQVVHNGGPPCFHLGSERFCLRAERWAGHEPDAGPHGHPFASFADFLADVVDTAAREALAELRGILARGRPADNLSYLGIALAVRELDEFAERFKP
jgi:broad specificity phosphatase PhoE